MHRVDGRGWRSGGKFGLGNVMGGREGGALRYPDCV